MYRGLYAVDVLDGDARVIHMRAREVPKRMPVRAVSRSTGPYRAMSRSLLKLERR